MSQVEQFLDSGPLPPSRHSTRGLRVVLGIVIVLVVAAAVALGFLIVRGSGGAQDYPGPGSGSATVVVTSGQTITQIGQTLQKADVVKSAEAFVAAAAAEPKSASIGPGRYTLKLQMSGAGAVQLMLDSASRAGSRLVLPEGLRLTQTVQEAAKATGIRRRDFEAALAEPGTLGLPAWAKNRPEGFMFPATYDLTGDETASSILTRFVTRFDQASASLDLEGKAATLGRRPYQVLIVASLVQAEGTPADFAKIARVIYNRLDKGMPLQLDSTVSYALGVTKLQLSQDELTTDSPYNTYLNTGLPPTPINSPGEAAIAAALAPEKGDWLYFVTTDPQSRTNEFTSSYKKFLKLKAKFQANAAATTSPSPSR